MIRPQEPYLSIRIELTFSSLDTFYETAAIFDSWKARESRQGWINSGWQLHSQTNGHLFINSYREVVAEQRADLVHQISRTDINITDFSHRIISNSQLSKIPTS